MQNIIKLNPSYHSLFPWASLLEKADNFDFAQPKGTKLAITKEDSRMAQVRSKCYEI
ncbi:hypothetical protein QQ054_31250 [Oscillatoria amoena NRMC-F 0135]|uniref:Uncharacterized protein n=1 Tax=Desertifilum tharense IPPAS B-1220 TaxID=1781255 RepID=A0ACD5GZV9_9CYAN|nr:MULTISPECIES: hypothetical protein [unclassified Desertifilum]MBD2334981.1 hypothetical protein [Desertifilum sp. FACHB-868]MDI9635756.1 hypothetical protein [Geitlerinema splendidum]MDL5050482.1 hypothetical protein [Oscillatoria amoena NRMC-F 0135]